MSESLCTGCDESYLRNEYITDMPTRQGSIIRKINEISDSWAITIAIKNLQVTSSIVGPMSQKIGPQVWFKKSKNNYTQIYMTFFIIKNNKNIVVKCLFLINWIHETWWPKDKICNSNVFVDKNIGH